MLIYFTHYTHMCVCVCACVYVWGVFVCVCVRCSRVSSFQLCLTLSSFSSIFKVSYDRENKVCSWHWHPAYGQLLFFYLEVAWKGLFPWIWFNLVLSRAMESSICPSVFSFVGGYFHYSKLSGKIWKVWRILPKF